MSSTYSLTTPTPIVHVYLDKPRSYKPPGLPEGEPKYSANFIFSMDHPDLAGIKSAAIEAAKAGWPGRDLKEIHWPWTAGNALIAKRANKARVAGKQYDPARDEYMKDKLVLPGRSKNPIQLIGIENRRPVEYDTPVLITQNFKKMFYPGVEALGVFTFVPYPGVGTDNNVACYLNMVLSTGKGTRLAFGRTAQEAFSGYLGGLSSEDPTGGAGFGDEEIPF